jgi:hypothetical protein
VREIPRVDGAVTRDSGVILAGDVDLAKTLRQVAVGDEEAR